MRRLAPGRTTTAGLPALVVVAWVTVLFSAGFPPARVQPASATSASASVPAAIPLPLPPPPSAPAATTDNELPAHAEDVADYTLVAKLDPEAHTVHGSGSLRWRNTSSVPIREVWVHLYLNAFKNEASTFLREPIGGFRGTEALTDWGYIDVQHFALHDADGVKELWPSVELRRVTTDSKDNDETDARVPLPRAILPGETAVFDIEWQDKLPSVLERTGYLGSFHFVGQWFPKIARLESDGRWAHFAFHHLAEFYADYGTYDVTLDVPKSFVLGATGPVVESHVQGGRRIERHVQADVHDFAWTAWDHWQVEEETIAGVRVKVLYPSGCRSLAQRELATMRFALPHFADKYGRYPYPVLTLVHPPQEAAEAGGMEYPTLITTGGPWYEPAGVLEVELVTLHEFGHQYFYGLVGSDEVLWPFLDEGLNSYAEEEGMEAWRGAGSMANVLGFTLSDAAVQAVFSHRAAHEEPVAQPAFAFSTGANYGKLVYGRTATILETLRRVYGDALTTRALGRYARKNRFRHPTPQDLFADYDEALGTKVTNLLRVALFEKGWVDYAIAGIFGRKSTPAAGIFDNDGKRQTVPEHTAGNGDYDGWVLVSRRGTLAFPVDIELTLDNGTSQRLHWDGEGDSVRLPYHGNVALRAAVVDPDHAVLLDEDLRNNHATVATERPSAATRTLERAMYWAELVVQAVGP